MSNDDNTRYIVPREEPISAGIFALNWKLFWIISTVVTGLLTLAIASAAGHMLIGMGLVVILVMTYIALVGIQPLEGLRTTVLAILFRGLYHRWSKLVHGNYNSEQPVSGEVFGLYNAQRQTPKAIPQIGKVRFNPYFHVNGVLGIGRDETYHMHSATMVTFGGSLLSDDQGTVQNKLLGFAGLLDGMANDQRMISRFAWRDQTFVGEHSHAQSMQDAIRSGARLDRSNPPNGDVFVHRTAELGKESVVHRTTLTIAAEDKLLKANAKQAGGEAEVFLQVLQGFHAAVMGAEVGRSPVGVKAASYLSYNDLVLENRLALDPVYAQSLWQLRDPHEDQLNLYEEQLAWPGFADFGPYDHCVIGETYHSSFYVAEFTRTGMPSDHFWHVLKLAVPKTVTTVFDMVPPLMAARYARYRSTAEEGMNFDRLTSSNRRITAEQQVSAEAAASHEMEIARNQGQVGRIRCYIDLTAPTLETLRNNAQLLRSTCAEARFVLEPLTGRQYLGVTATLPLARGLATLSLPSTV